MLLIGSHHKQAIIKLINCITNSNSNQTTNRSQSLVTIDGSIFVRLKQIIKVYDSVINKTIKSNINNEDNYESKSDDIVVDNNQNNSVDSESEAKTYVRSWLMSNYDCQQSIDHLFSHWIQSIECFPIESLNMNSSEDKLWTISLLVLNILYKMRNCLTDHKMMLELGWICLSELDSTLTQFKPNFNQILKVLQNALNEEKKDNKQELEECQQLSHEVKRLRQKIIELQRNIIKVNKEKQVLGKKDNISKTVGLRKQMVKNAVKRGLNRETNREPNQSPADDDDEDDDEIGETDQSLSPTLKRKRQPNG